MEQTLYEWQKECLKLWLNNGARGMVQAVTGSGKTRLALCAIDELERMLGRDVMVKIVTPTSALMRQWADALQKHRNCRDEIGLRGGGRKDPANRRYMIYVINSARYELARQILGQLEEGKAVFLIADECHRYASGENHLIFEYLTRIDISQTACYSLGLSATLPSGQDGHALAKALGPCIYTYEMAKASAMRTVCPFDLFHISLTFQKDEREEYDDLTERLRHCWTQLRRSLPYSFPEGMTQKERFEKLRHLAGGKDKRTARLASNYIHLTYKRKKLICMTQARISCAEELVCRLDPDDKILIFGERIAQAEELYQILYRRYPGRVGRCHSHFTEQTNRNTLECFRTGEFRILITCRSMDEGVDIPDASIGIILSGTSTQRQRTQRLGRIIRRHNGKERASLYYLHMEDSVEDVCYLPDTGESRIFELSYDPQTQIILNPAYDEAARTVLDNLRLAGANQKTLSEAHRCLDIGRVRGDWMSEPETLEKQIRLASGVEERNYWVCMKRICQARSD